ncbi:hypothetical protein BS47DRAFT_161501 [Hydnum rufescens UP504]|uniref:Uncharacterized protein n=1 Tax=Hydnum rufescens UP504 TaxID=1448309 RepID=A0A9P6AP33_9AGAM|nr:hypothetical protein BS47DRAFT_161501 [Hydnum rufescens UP504]
MMTATSGTANAEVACPGLVSWVSTVRMELSSATGAADFAEFVQVKGFDWLASYVEGVLNDEPIFELAKTPGRQKSAKDRLSPIKRIALPPISALNFTSAAADLSMISEGDERDAPSLSKSLGGNFITASSTSTVFPKAPVDSNLQPSHDRSLAGGARRELRLSEPESSQPTEAPQAVYPIPDPVSDPTPVKAVNLEPSHSQPPAADQNRAGTDEIAPKDDTAQEDIVESAIRPVVDLSQTTQAAEPEIQMKKTSIEPVTTNRAPESQNIATTAEVASTTGISASSVRPTVSRPSVSQTSRFGKDAVIRTVSISTRLSTHQDVVVPTKQSSPAPGSRTTAPARSSWVQRALGASAGSSAPSRLRKSSFAARAPPASTPETGTSSSSAEVVSSTSGSGLSEDSGDNAEKNAGAGAKRKSDVALNEDGEEDAQESSRTRKTLKLDGDALPPLLGEKQTEPQNSLGRRSPPHLRSTRSIVFKADSGVSKHPHGDGAHEDVPRLPPHRHWCPMHQAKKQACQPLLLYLEPCNDNERNEP